MVDGEYKKPTFGPCTFTIVIVVADLKTTESQRKKTNKSQCQKLTAGLRQRFMDGLLILLINTCNTSNIYKLPF